jgi:hypothetical protein
MAKKKTTKWFKYTRKSYLPAAWQGLVIYLIYVTYIVVVPIIWYRKGHNLWTLVSEVIPLMLAAVILTQYIASSNSNRK